MKQNKTKITRIAAILAVCMLAVASLAACGGATPQPTGGVSGNVEPGKAEGSYFDVGDFTVEMPAGWTAYPQDDIFGDKDENGNYPIDPTNILIGKGSTSEWDAMVGPNVRIYYYGPGHTTFDSRDMYNDVRELKDVKINGVACSAFQGDSIGYVYQFITYPMTEDEIYEIQVLTSVDGKETGITWDNAEVKSILESITTKNVPESSKTDKDKESVNDADEENAESVNVAEPSESTDAAESSKSTESKEASESTEAAESSANTETSESTK